MSKQQLEEIIGRMRDEPDFRHQLKSDPERALHGYDVTYAERAALIAGDETKLQQLGVSHDLSRLAAQYNGEGSRTP
jgi:hypothetical protein